MGVKFMAAVRAVAVWLSSDVSGNFWDVIGGDYE
jgi:hypothetical protein